MDKSVRARTNPFYVLLLAVSTLVVVTALAYLVSPSVLARAPRGGSPAAEWLDRHGPLALGIEFAVMLVSGILAMATDRLFSGAAPKAR